MYSPKISEELIPSLYRLAKAGKMPMTRFVDGIIRKALADVNPPGSAAIGCSSLYVRESEPCFADPGSAEARAMADRSQDKPQRKVA